MDIFKFFDKYRLIGNYKPVGSIDELGRTVGPGSWIDGGDSSHRMGMYHFILNMMRRKNIKIPPTYPDSTNNDFFKALDLLECVDNIDNMGTFKRHPDPDFWYSESDRMSRDQLTPILAALVLIGDDRRLLGIFKSHLSRGLLFTTNTRRNGATKANHGQVYKKDKDGNPVKRDYSKKMPDITGPAIWAMYIRGFKVWWLYPLLCILDVEYLINSILKRTLLKDDTDVINHLIVGILSSEIMPTPAIYIANRYINKLSDMTWKIRHYFRQPEDPKFLGAMLELVVQKILRY